MGWTAVATRGGAGSTPAIASVPPPRGTYSVRYQSLSWTCGPAALGNALRALGTAVAEPRLSSLSGCTEDEGADEHGLMAAARELGFKATAHWSADKAAAWAFVRSSLLDGRPCLLCINNWGHWVTVIGMLGNMIVVDDPSTAATNTKENGTHVFGRQRLLKRWRHRHEAEPYYAIAIGR